MDKNLKKGLAIFAASYGKMRLLEIETKLMRTHILDMIDVSDGPESVRAWVASASIEELNGLRLLVKLAARKRDWSVVEAELNAVRGTALLSS